jgi:hypothetical protein
VAIAVTRIVALELDQLRALGKSGRAAALSAMRRRAADARPAANGPRPWENNGPVATFEAGAQAQALQVPGTRHVGGDAPRRHQAGQLAGDMVVVPLGHPEMVADGEAGHR